jgi:hypothetical protein
MKEIRMSKPNRTPAQARIARSIAIRKERTQRSAMVGGALRTETTPDQGMPAALLADCVAAGGFDQNARFEG